MAPSRGLIPALLCCLLVVGVSSRTAGSFAVEEMVLAEQEVGNRCASTTVVSLPQLLFTICTSRSEYGVGQFVDMKLSWTNVSPRLSNFTGVATVRIIDPVGAERFSQHALLRWITVLLPGETESLTLFWTAQPPVGEYVILSSTHAQPWGFPNIPIATEAPPIAITVLPSMDVAIDIKPGTDANSLSLRSEGLVPVAILSKEGVEAAAVDPSSVRFGRTGTDAHSVRSALEDVDRDGDLDLILHFNVQDTGFRLEDTKGILTGKIIDGPSVTGIDSVRIIYRSYLSRF